MTDTPQAELLYHGTKATLEAGDLLGPGFASNYGRRRTAAYVYLTATLDAATWGAELARGEGPGRIYIVEPTGAIEDDPNLTDKKFPGKPITILLEKNNKFPNPVWRIIWGESLGTSNFSIFVDASIGDFKEKMR